jgi:NAD+ diphosphatase
MSVISFPKKFSCTELFAFWGNDILLKNSNLLSGDDAEFFLSEGNFSDYFCETNLSYCAMEIRDAQKIPRGCRLISLREFFFVQPEKSFLASRAKSLLCQRKVFKFCPVCGKILEDDETESAKKCIPCSKKFFPRIEPCTITLVSRGDEILLVKNRNSTYRNFACVSGFVESGETLEECVHREVLEETNLKIKNVKYLGSQSWPYPDQLMAAFSAEFESGDLKIQESEICEARWFKKNSLPEQSELPRPGSVAHKLIFGLF